MATMAKYDIGHGNETILYAHDGCLTVPMCPSLVREKKK